MSKIDIYFDGACHNEQDKNCPMGLGIAVFVGGQYQEDLSRAILVENHETDGTSNIAEWLALCEAMKIAEDLRITYNKQNLKQIKINVFGDSKLIVNQFNLIWRINEEKFKPYFSQARACNATAKVGELIWIPREKNQKADELSKLGLRQFSQRRYQIKASHPESDSEWIEYQTDHQQKLQAAYDMVCEKFNLGEEVILTILDTQTNQEIFLNK